MPKVINNLENKILDSARVLLLSGGYKEFNIRKIAKQCDIGIGTIYNYYSSKEDVIVRAILDDCDKALKRFDEEMKTQASVTENIVNLYRALRNFKNKYKDICYRFSDNFEDIFLESNEKIYNEIYSRMNAILLKTEKDHEIMEYLSSFFTANLMTAVFKECTYIKNKELTKRFIDKILEI